MILPSPFLILMTSCSFSNKEDCSSDEDLDSDGLHDCLEMEIGTDINKEDSDGDGFSDVEEYDCVSDPLNSDEVCYACGWGHNDPQNLTSTGAERGDVIDNLQLYDQCEDLVDLWDFYGEYHILYMTAAW